MTTPSMGWYPDQGFGPVVAAALPKFDPFYKYDAAKLADKSPGTVLRSRRLPYHVAGLPTPFTATQLLYRSTSQTGNPTANVTSVIQPPFQPDKTKVLSYQSFYDSLNQNDEPSFAIAGGRPIPTLPELVNTAELAVFAPFLAEGYTVVVADIEGQRADFAAGPEYGMNTLDSIRAAFGSKQVGLPGEAKVALLGYSGGALATEWAAELAPTYAPEVNKRLIGAAMGGLLVHPAHNLHYVDGSRNWAGVMLMALVGIARAFEKQDEFRKYLNAEGTKLFDAMQSKSIVDVLGKREYSGLTWAQLVEPAYPSPESIPLYVECVNKLIMGTGGISEGPAAPGIVPLFIGQGANGELEGTPGDKPHIGPGDGVMIAGDVRTLARGYCERTPVWYEEYEDFSHFSSLVLWLPHAIAWVRQRFAGEPAPQNCSTIEPGNSLDPTPVPA
ncbi:Secretory lipase [Mycolicibacterium chubuense NBB4]|uniref:Secretory lipase n=1 Tax=Mycolicibacterium chubuense (strain NBB4) TaxID=710421 RepID=I4BLA9_MYCCN|nr:lipase family protein [Mycolicibacterium chubuense]AFM18066.1 Secretory lipase [Mycolicibacterium chubuense NBB4]